MATYAAYRHVELDNVGYGKKRVLKPPGGGSSDIFGASAEETSPRRVKSHQASQLGSALFGDNARNGPSHSTNGPDTPRVTNKPGNDSYKRLFGPPDALPNQNSKNHMKSNIPLSGESTTVVSPAKSTSSSNGSICNGTISNDNLLINDNTAFRRKKRFRGASCMPRNPVTGDGVDVTPIRRTARKCRDGNPVTGTGYGSDQQNNVVQNGSGNANSSGSEKSNDSSPGSGNMSNKVQRNRVPPGGYSSGLW
ncbi:microtubule-associated protein Jupiter isoform X1 [Leptopilina heterotoma]|uniref:microtubule-associated protein Jupiter isoform X1 n=1 Tax=Leptopilina heterotoma TaxID=63436 RepID=UPI001CA7BB14|nr:microtubule-associated protein Jupiter isoform X1 [Leptopilina heterotoma]